MSGPLVFLLLDGLGIAPASEANALSLSKLSVFNDLVTNYPVALLNVKKKSLNARYLSLGSGHHFTIEEAKADDDLTKIISSAGYKQIKIGETERLAALTYFFNGGREGRLLGEDIKIVSSKPTRDNDENQAMSKITKELILALESEQYNFLTVSLPSLDLAAQTGDLEKIIKTANALDKNLAEIVEVALDYEATLVISAACGNAENVKSMATELTDREMTDNSVPLIIVEKKMKGKTFGLSEPVNGDLSLLSPLGGLEDVAPTILELMNLSVPKSMSGHSLINKKLK